MRDVNEGGVKSFNVLGSMKKRWLYYGMDSGRRRRSRTGIIYLDGLRATYGHNVASSDMSEVSLFGVGTVVRCARDA